jgi:hypothetical protein
MQFSPPQKSLIYKALNEAEKRTTQYYCIPPFRWERLHYDLLTQADQDWDPLPDSMLARVRLLQKTGIRRSYDFYRIELNDPSILAAAERENLLRSSQLYPFFMYILTHEMVHLVRLSTILDHRLDAPESSDESEENRVRNISRRILSGYSDLLPALERFCSSTPFPNSSVDSSNDSM